MATHNRQTTGITTDASPARPTTQEAPQRFMTISNRVPFFSFEGEILAVDQPILEYE